MKAYFPSFIIIILALSLVHTGFARSELLLCQNKCEQSQWTKTDVPACCSGKIGDNHSMAQAAGHDMDTPDCPHLNCNKKITDPLPLLTTSTASPSPDKLPASAGVILSPMNQQHPTGSAVRPGHTGLSPPGFVEPPSYYLYCSLLI